MKISQSFESKMEVRGARVSFKRNASRLLFVL